MANEKSFNLNDASVSPAAIALPASASTSIVTASIDLNAVGPFTAPCELEISAPALGATPLPNGETMIYDVQDSADDSTFADVASALITQTGAGGAGDAAEVERYRLPSTIRRYVLVQATSSGSAGDASGSNLTVKLLF